MNSGLFDFWLRFGSVTGLFKPAPSPKPRQKPKILAAHRYIFSVNALVEHTLEDEGYGKTTNRKHPVNYFVSPLSHSRQKSVIWVFKVGRRRFRARFLLDGTAQKSFLMHCRAFVRKQREDLRMEVFVSAPRILKFGW